MAVPVADGVIGLELAQQILGEGHSGAGGIAAALAVAAHQGIEGGRGKGMGLVILEKVTALVLAEGMVVAVRQDAEAKAPAVQSGGGRAPVVTDKVQSQIHAHGRHLRFYYSLPAIKSEAEKLFLKRKKLLGEAKISDKIKVQPKDGGMIMKYVDQKNIRPIMILRRSVP